jgi:hypothetical protein
MDPNIMLGNFRYYWAQKDFELAAAYMKDLDDWLSSGGFKPADWEPLTSAQPASKLQAEPTRKPEKMPDTIKIELTPDEAYALRIVLDRVGGCPVNTKRGLINNINAQLISAGVEYCNDQDIVEPELDGIWFAK